MPSISAHGRTGIIGFPGDLTDGSEGEVYLLIDKPSGWARGKRVNTDEPGDGYGSTVALNDNFVFIRDTAADDSGFIRVYTRVDLDVRYIGIIEGVEEGIQFTSETNTTMCKTGTLSSPFKTYFNVSSYCSLGDQMIVVQNTLVTTCYDVDFHIGVFVEVPLSCITIPDDESKRTTVRRLTDRQPTKHRR